MCTTALFLAVPILGFLGLTLVIMLFAFRYGDLYLGQAAVIEIDAEWHDCHAFTLSRIPELGDLALVQQKLAISAWLMKLHHQAMR